jgi:hypothetical protein
MHLLNTTTLKLQYFIKAIPPYAILSHTWGDEEVTFDDIDKPHAAGMKGYQKILESCAQALEDGFLWIWIDTCCIDKRSSAELSEAINSMYNWYWDAEVCYAYLSDVPIKSFVESVWFTRGWTLQELLAPAVVEFYSQDWKRLGTKLGLVDDVHCATGIEKIYLLHRSTIQSAPIGKRFSWAAYRETTRVEDVAYSLLGLVQINMPMLYGEGHRAFYRLQLEVLKTSRDHTIFVWEPRSDDMAMTGFTQPKKNELYVETFGMLARSPDWFGIHRGKEIECRVCPKAAGLLTHEMTNMGLRITLPCTEVKGQGVFAFLNCRLTDRWAAVRLQKRNTGRYKRSSDLAIQYFAIEQMKKAVLVEMLVVTECTLDDSLNRSRCNFKIKSLRIWDSPQGLASVDWMTHPYFDQRFPNSRRSMTSLDHECSLHNHESGALRLQIGGIAFLIAFAQSQHQICLAVLHTSHDGDEELAPVSKLFRTRTGEYHRDVLQTEECGWNFVVAARKQLWRGSACWMLTVELWHSSAGKPDSDSTSRPCIVIENDGDDRVLAEGQNLRGIGVTR